MPPTRPSAGVRAISSSRERRCSWAANSSGPYSTKLPSSSRSARFSRAVRRPALAAARDRLRARRVESDRVALAHRARSARSPPRRRLGRGRDRRRRASPRRGRASAAAGPPRRRRRPRPRAGARRRRSRRAPRAPSSSPRARPAARRPPRARRRVRDRDDDPGERGRRPDARPLSAMREIIAQPAPAIAAAGARPGSADCIGARRRREQQLASGDGRAGDGATASERREALKEVFARGARVRRAAPSSPRRARRSSSAPATPTRT